MVDSWIADLTVYPVVKRGAEESPVSSLWGIVVYENAIVPENEAWLSSASELRRFRLPEAER